MVWIKFLSSYFVVLDSPGTCELDFVFFFFKLVSPQEAGPKVLVLPVNMEGSHRFRLTIPQKFAPPGPTACARLIGKPWGFWQQLSPWRLAQASAFQTKGPQCRAGMRAW